VAYTTEKGENGKKREDGTKELQKNGAVTRKKIEYRKGGKSKLKGEDGGKEKGEREKAREEENGKNSRGEMMTQKGT